MTPIRHRAMQDQSATSLDASELRIGIVVSRYHREITDSLVAGAEQTFLRAGGSRDCLWVFEAAGAWELTAVCRAAVDLEDADGEPRLDAIVAIGCILTGETAHDQVIAQSVVQGLTAITVETGVPITFGVLTCQSKEHARARSGLDGDTANNKGAEAMAAAIVTLGTIRSMPGLNGDAI